MNENDYNSSEENTNFYRSKTWDLLMGEIQEIKRNQTSMASDITIIKNQRAYMMGIVMTISVLASSLYQWIIGNIRAK